MASRGRRPHRRLFPAGKKAEYLSTPLRSAQMTAEGKLRRRHRAMPGAAGAGRRARPEAPLRCWPKHQRRAGRRATTRVAPTGEDETRLRDGPGFCAERRGRTPYLVGRLRSGVRVRKRPEKSLIFPQKTLDPGKTLCYNPFYLSDERFLFARFFPRAQGPRRPNREAMPAKSG